MGQYMSIRAMLAMILDSLEATISTPGSPEQPQGVAILDQRLFLPLAFVPVCLPPVLLFSKIS